MIPVEYFWGVLFVVFGIIGMARGLWKELGVTTLLLLSLFALKVGWERVGEKILPLLQKVPLAEASTENAQAIYYTVTILFVAYIAYEGITLKFPIRQMVGLLKAAFGLLGGLLNGYLIVGTIWDVVAQANYFQPDVSLVAGALTDVHNTIIQYLPVTFINEFVLLGLGMVLLLAIVLK
jgi:uncharacterized membrane protein required for colicin V production